MISKFQRENILKLAIQDEKLRSTQLSRMADEVCFCIVDEESTEIDIILAKQKARELCSELFPDELYLYDMIYEARFRRLEEQFRQSVTE